MAQATPAGEGRAAPSVKVPLRLRLKAWWDGHEIRVKDGASGPDVAEQAGRQEPEPFVRWSAPHLEVAQSIWGDGMIGPTGPDEILELVKPLSLNPSMNLLHVGAGLGGAGRVLTESFGVWVTGLEADRALVKAGMAKAEAAGVAKKAPVAIYDPENFEPKVGSFDAIVTFGHLFTVRNRTRLLDMLDLALKRNGQILITDFVLPKPGLESRGLADWLADEPDAAEPWSVQQYKVALEGRGLDVRIIEDRSNKLREQVVKSWADHMAEVNQEASDPRTAAALVHEVELWTRRTRALETGDLRHCRIYARRRASTNLLSDW